MNHFDMPRLGRIPTLAVLLMLPSMAAGQSVGSVELMELTIADAHEAMLARTLTSRQLVQAYLARIDAYDRNGPTINAIIMTNPRALARADSLDRELRRTGELTGPLHGIPFIVKDNYDTHDMPTTGGSASLAGSMAANDAYQVRRIREAGAIVLAKSNLAEFAFTALETVGSMLPGWTFNPYALNRVTAGSSGGTAAAVTANMGLIGLGTDTGNSIRGPSSHNALVGIRSTQGLTSRDGIMPLYAHRDIGGPMGRTVEDAVRVFDVIAGSDPEDPVTSEADERRAESYMEYLDTHLSGIRIGVVGQIAYKESADPEILMRFAETFAVLERLGATVVRDFHIQGLDELRRGTGCSRFRYDIESYLADIPNPPVSTLQEIANSGRVYRTVLPTVERFLSFEGTPDTNEQCIQGRAREERFREGLRAAMAEYEVQALIYPSWSNPPRLVGDMSTPHGDNSQYPAPPTGFPALTVPMGFVRDGTLPAGLQVLGDAWSEPTLIQIAYAFEQATMHRKPPPTTPPLTN
ncbi:MAG: amidase family protein [Gemmatimonadota bacterium]|nr:amidase family protein [Gemmatimonadota bacterium]MDE3005888.1 amidase family protein [Gemmatimonadota bacterium]